MNENTTKGSELFNRAYASIKAIAEAKMRNERASHTLTPTALVNEAFLKLHDLQDDIGVEEFVFKVSRVMRNHLIDYSRYKNAKKRSAPRSGEPIDAIESSLTQRYKLGPEFSEFVDWLDCQDESLQTVFNLRLFGGYTSSQIAAVTGLSPATVKRRLNMLFNQLESHLI